MRLLMVAIVLIFSSQNKLFAAKDNRSTDPVIMKMALTIDGQLISRPSIITSSGETAVVENFSENGEGYFLEVTPQLQGNNQVIMDFKVGKIVDRKKVLYSRPRILANLKQEASITVGENAGKFQELSLAVTAEKM